MRYLDANVFIHAALNDQNLGIAARSLLSTLMLERRKVVSSTLTLDEVAWKIKRHQGKQKMLTICRSLLANPHIEWISPSPAIMKMAFDLMEQFDLDPRDAIHAATCQNEGIQEIISEDQELDRLNEIDIKRIRISESIRR